MIIARALGILLLLNGPLAAQQMGALQARNNLGDVPSPSTALSNLGGYAASNPSGYISASGAPVQSVAGQTGTVTNLSAGTVTPTGASASISFATRFSWLANAFDYGATGTGTTDDSTAVNTAAGTGKPLIFSPGSYKLTAASLTNTPSLIMGFGTNLPLNGPSGVSNQAYWNGQSGLLLGKTFTGSTGQATLVVNAINNQPSGNTGESAAIYASTLSNSPYTTGLAGIFQASAGTGNTNASLSSINAYSLWPSGTQGSGSVSEMDVYNSTGTDDAWPLSSTTAKAGLLLVSDGTNKPTYAWGVAESGGAPFHVGGYFFYLGTDQYDLYGQGASKPRWYVDSSGNIMGQNVYAQTMQLGTFSAAPSLTISTGVGVPSSSQNPGSIYINTNQGIPSNPQLYLNTSVGSAGTNWGQICTTNVACTFGNLKGTVLTSASNTLDDGAGNATITGALTIPTQATSDNSTKAASTAFVKAVDAAAIPAASGQLLGGSGAPGTASAITVGSGLTLTSGTLTATGSGTVTSVAVSGGTTGLTTSGGPVTGSGTITLGGTLAVANGGTGGTTSTGSGAVVLATSPTLVTPALGTPSSATLTNATGLPVGGISATGTPSSTTYLRGDGSWSTPPGSGGGSGTVNSGTAGQIAYYASNGTAVSGVTITPPTITVLTSGSGTYTKPTGAVWLQVEMIGGGSGGAGSGNVLTGLQSSAGGNTTFGTSFLVANGGGSSQFAAGAGGTASIGTGATGIAYPGSPGADYFQNSGQLYVTGSHGAPTRFGAAFGTSGAGKSAPANSGAGGAGGGGQTSAVQNGASGSSGGYVNAIIASPSSTYSYAVGASGAGGSAGTSGYAGGAGGSGVIIITEHYGW